MNSPVIDRLLATNGVISDQVNKQQIAVVLQGLVQALERQPEGAVAEFGCYIGTTSLYIRRLLDALGQKRDFYAYDSFVGLPPKTAQDLSANGTEFQGGELAVSKKQFLQAFQKAGLRPPTTHKAWFRDLTEAQLPKTLAFAFLDGDFYESIRDSLELVWPRLLPAA